MEVNVIKAGMAEWEQKTCFQFREYSTKLAKDLGHDQRILIRDDLAGCQSHVGMMPDFLQTPQTVS